VVVHCAVCLTELAPGLDACPRCGSGDIMVGVHTPEGIRISAARGGGVTVTGKDHDTVRGRFLRQHLKLEYSSGRQRMEYVERIFDHVNRTYREVYYHPETGEVVFEKQGPIEDQSIHGRRRQ
jgi:hypothetical protein